jgi:hypothetical protein
MVRRRPNGSNLAVVKKHYVVIVLGLGEAAPMYRLLVKNWEERFGIIPIIHVFGWKNQEEAFSTKLTKLTDQIESLAKDKHSISLIGISAGASASLHAYAYAKEKGIGIQSYISICGRFNRDAYPWYPLSYGVERISAFKESITMVPASKQKLSFSDYKKMQCFYSLFDEVVPTSASILPNVKKHRIPCISHNLSIYLAFLDAKKLISKI